jgi:hypothetical protein
MFTLNNIHSLIKSEFTGLAAREILQQPITVLIGVSDSVAEAISTLGIRTVFDLATSRVFGAANSIAESSDASPNNLVAQYGFAPTDWVQDEATSKTVESLQLEDIEILDGIDSSNRDSIVQAIQLQTIRDFALWPPYRAAKRILNNAFSIEEFAEDPDAPSELLPTAGEYATEKAYYSTIFLDEIEEGKEDLESIENQLDILSIDQSQGFQRPATGAVLTFEQAWYPEGLSLGQLLHSLALAPGESTKVAVLDWARQESTDVSEAIDQRESLSNRQSQSRAISEIHQGVAEESLSGFSFTSSYGKTTTSGRSGGVGGGLFGKISKFAFGIGGGFATTRGESTTQGRAFSVSSSRGRRQISSEMMQGISQSTQQNASSVRTRRASVVREVTQAEQETLRTRTITNYNHSHALSVHYYEVVQIYRITNRLSKAERCIFVPMKILDFNDERILSKYKNTLKEAAHTEEVRELLATAEGEITFQTASNRTTEGLVNIVNREKYRIANGGSEAIEWDPGARLTTVSVVNSNGGVIRTITIQLDDRSSIRLSINVEKKNIDIEEPPLASDIQRIRIDYESTNDSNRTSNASFGVLFGFLVENEEQNLVVNVAAKKYRNNISILRTVKPQENRDLAVLLNEEALYYSQAVWTNLSQLDMSLLLSNFQFKGKRLIEYIDTDPITTYGNYLVFPYHFEDEGLTPNERESLNATSLLELQSWSNWKAKHASFAEISQQTIAVGTGGTFAEAVLGRFNASEKLDLTRFWNWQDSPIPNQAPEIAPLQAGSRAIPDNTTPGRLDAPVVNIMNPPSLPDPTSSAAILQALSTPNIFRDPTGLAETITLAQQLAQTTSAGATAGADISSQNYRAALDAAVKLAALAGQQKTNGIGGQNPSYTGAVVNEIAKSNGGQGNSGGGTSFQTGRGNSGGTSSGAGITSGGSQNGGNAPQSLREKALRGMISPALSSADAFKEIAGSLSGKAKEGEANTGRGGGGSTEIQTVTTDGDYSYWLPILNHRPDPVDIQRVSEKFVGSFFAPDPIPNGWPLQLIEDGRGSVTFDRFSLEISQFPEINNSYFEPAELIRHIRLKLNSFVDTDLAFFEPYDDIEAKLWRQSDPTGSLLAINTLGRLPSDDFAVICTGADALSWKFTTCWTSKNWGHPLSGVRHFGIEKNNDGNYELFTAAADRPTTLLDQVLIRVNQNIGQQLWEGFIERVAEFVNKNGGQASNIKQTKFSISWEQIVSAGDFSLTSRLPLDVYYWDVPLIPQPTPNSCWATGVAMIKSWKDQASFNPENVAEVTGYWRQYYQDGLPPDDDIIFSFFDMAAQPAQTYTVEGFYQLLENYGPLWVASSQPGPHIRVVIGMQGDGTADGTLLYINDPWEDGMTQYRPNNKGSRITETYNEFIRKQAELAQTELDEQAIYVAHLKA